MTLSDLSVYLEQTAKQHPIVGLMYLERCVEKAKIHGPSFSCRQELELILKDLKKNAEKDPSKAKVINEVTEKVTLVIKKFGFDA